MSDAILAVGFAGPLVSVQDAGRFGFMRFGVPASGPMDALAFAAANAALGNALNVSCVEVSMGGVQLRGVSGRVAIAVAGGAFQINCKGTRLGSWSVVTISAGDELSIQPGFWGNWCYIAFAGKLDVKPWLGSAATHWLSGLGGGRVTSGDTIRIADARVAPEGPIPCPVMARPRHEFRVTLGPQDRFFDTDTVGSFLTTHWRISNAYDRMGVRLEGPKIASKEALSIPSEPITRGAIQVSGDGVPAVLLADHQTTGGYPKIATVINSDLSTLSQLRPRAPITFRIVSPSDALMIARRRKLRASLYIEAISQARHTVLR